MLNQYAGSTANGAALSLSALDEAIDQTLNPTHLIMNKAMRRRLTVAARDTSIGGFISYQKDAFGRQINHSVSFEVLKRYNEGFGRDHHFTPVISKRPEVRFGAG